MKKEMDGIHITADKRVILNGKEFPRCTRVAIVLEPSSDPEVELRVAVDRVDIDGYTNGMTDMTFPSQSTT